MATLEDAKRRLPLPYLMNQYGHSVPTDGKRGGFKCPFCSKKSAYLRGQGQVWFKCHNDTCCSGTSEPKSAWDEVRFYGYQHRLSTAGAPGQYSEAAIAFMKEAGVWKERSDIPPSVMPGQQRRRNPVPKPPAAPSTEDEEMVLKCTELVRAEGKASVSLLQRRLTIGYGRASRMMDELEKRGVVGPAKGNEAREVLQNTQNIQAPKDPIDTASGDAANVAASVADEKSPTEIQSCSGSAGVDTETPKDPSTQAPSVEMTGVPADMVIPKMDVQMAKPVSKEKDPTGVLAMREFYAELGRDEDGGLSPRDREVMSVKRGLTTLTVEALGFRSNPRSNSKIIDRLKDERGEAEMVAAGFWLKADRKKKLKGRINSQFCGKGQAGKIPKAERRNARDKVKWGWVEPVLIPYFDEKGEMTALRPHKGGAPAWTACGGKSLYVPRSGFSNKVFRRLTDGALEEERFETVVVTEGEFKAAALWQEIGIGARQFMDDEGRQMYAAGPEFGVCAVPGISYAKHFETREVLEEWLRVVGCRHVIVAFDREEKGEREKYPAAYEPDFEKRHDTQKYARYLATVLAKRLHIRASVCTLPDEWLNANGKADWDGALAMMNETEHPTSSKHQTPNTKHQQPTNEEENPWHES